MKTIERGSMPSGHPRAAVGNEPEMSARDQGHELLVRMAWGAATLLILLAAGFLAFGCGQSSDGRVSSATGSAPAAVAAQSQGGPTGGPTALLASEAGSTKSEREPNSDALAAVSADSLPPDVAASVSETAVLPGAAIEITAQGSPDVVGVTLGDDSGKLQAFAYDSNADLWRAAYRVPVMAADRPALSVTARNSAGRWRRVWVFLDVASKTAAGDSASTSSR